MSRVLAFIQYSDIGRSGRRFGSKKLLKFINFQRKNVMAYKCYELPNTDGNFTDVVLLDVNAENFETTPAYVHYAYTIPAPAENTPAASK